MNDFPKRLRIILFDLFVITDLMFLHTHKAEDLIKYNYDIIKPTCASNSLVFFFLLYLLQCLFFCNGVSGNMLQESESK